jgi:hypothetical protein
VANEPVPDTEDTIPTAEILSPEEISLPSLLNPVAINISFTGQQYYGNYAPEM